ncbi:aminotransferase class III-fold pyridoxal phosphate-dependent enzyme [Pseudodonghicola flavimaris]|uniref:Aminotransferase class III-fold pyridoxal phosphate-dependent enzyme n=1 Tax=Pseudodonghicola flavimaris TaxID=3050036 RepID=A0ABT7F593_9RHOB|nr:aminotransferase class III-fold pyridoxal phosphate-dependent enzyme [Pseudodonghicola flavimaris]MDK3019779.1 aminotransferase class III-fold pyridoxal phosphate-dependent enzyme [Pseudodonghicola flavimaris]
MSRLLNTSLTTNDEAPVYVVGGEGCWYELSDGRRVLDGSNSAGALGHRHPDMVETIRKAAEYPAISEGWAWKGRTQAAEDLIDIAFDGEGDWVGAVRFGLSGSEINDMALSLSQALTGRAAIGTRERAYHGLTGLSREVTTQPQWHGGLSRGDGSVSPAAPNCEVRVISAPDSSLYGQRVVQHPQMSPEEMTAVLSDAASVIVDYTQGGIYHEAGYQDQVAAAAKRAGALWIADEVVTGAGRSGRWFAFQGGQSRPDIVTMGKALAGGAGPIGAVILSRDICDELKDAAWQNYSTYRGHPTAMAGVSTYLRVLRRDGLLDRVAALEPVIGKRLVEIAQRHPSVSRVDGRGLHWTVEFHGPHWADWTAATRETPIASKVVAAAMAQGVSIGTSGEQTSLFLAPPLIISDAELDQLLQVLDHALTAADEEFARTAG